MLTPGKHYYHYLIFLPSQNFILRLYPQGNNVKRQTQLGHVDPYQWNLCLIHRVEGTSKTFTSFCPKGVHSRYPSASSRITRNTLHELPRPCEEYILTLYELPSPECFIIGASMESGTVHHGLILLINHISAGAGRYTARQH